MSSPINLNALVCCYPSCSRGSRTLRTFLVLSHAFDYSIKKRFCQPHTRNTNCAGHATSLAHDAGASVEGKWVTALLFSAVRPRLPRYLFWRQSITPATNRMDDPLRVAPVRSCVAAMLSSVAQTAELRRAFRRLVSLVAATCLFMARTLAYFQV